MLILAAPAPASAAPPWPGPLCLCLGPGDPVPESDATLVFDFAPAASSGLAMIRAVVTRLAARQPLDNAPLLFIRQIPQPEALTHWAALARADRFALDSRTDGPEGDLTACLIGAGIMHNPALVAFLRGLDPNLPPRETEPVLARLGQHLVPS